MTSVFSWKTVVAGATIFVTSGDDSLFLLRFLGRKSGRTLGRQALNMLAWVLAMLVFPFVAEIVVKLNLAVTRARPH